MICFDGTTKNLVPRAEDLPVQEETTIVRLLIDYESQLETPGQQIHAEYLTQAYELFKQTVQTKGISPERAHLAAEIYCHLCLWDEYTQVLLQYLESQPGTYEQLWANWCITDSCALQRRYQEVIRRQQEQLQWANDMHIPPEHQLCILNDTTQALCWLMVEQDAQWRLLLSKLLQRVVPTKQNREDRFLAVRTAVYVLNYAHQITEGLDWLKQLYAIAQEDELNDQYEFLLEADALHIDLAAANKEEHKVQEIAVYAFERIQQWISQAPDLPQGQRRAIRQAAHNVGAGLYGAHAYTSAIPFFQLSIQYGSSPFHGYLWLAGSKWKTGTSKQEVIALLRQAAEHDAGQRLPRKIWELPEFQDTALREDKDFLALCHRTSGVSSSR